MPHGPLYPRCLPFRAKQICPELLEHGSSLCTQFRLIEEALSISAGIDQSDRAVANGWHKPTIAHLGRGKRQPEDRFVVEIKLRSAPTAFEFGGCVLGRAAFGDQLDKGISNLARCVVIEKTRAPRTHASLRFSAKYAVGGVSRRWQ
jgi:hypothetical protein